MRLNVSWKNVMEQALGTIIGTAAIVAVTYIIQLITGQRSLLVLAVVGVIALVAIITLFRHAVWRWLATNWQFILLAAVVALGSLIVATYTRYVIAILVSPLVAVFAYLLALSHKRPSYSSDKSAASRESTQRPSTRLELFRQYLDQAVADTHSEISGLGLQFLDVVKAAPPFIGIRHEVPTISLPVEQRLTEYFRARAFMNEHGKFVLGGTTYQVRKGDTWETIAENTYGDPKFAPILMSKNPGVYELPNGLLIRTPFLDIHKSRNDRQEYLDAQFTIAHNWDAIAPTFQKIREKYSLVAYEVVPLVQMVYDVAQRTLKAAAPKP